MIKLNLNLSKIDKTRLVKGEKGIYIDLVLIETPDSKYGQDFMVVQDLGREASEAGEKGPILNNGKNWAKPEPRQATAEEVDDLPF